MALTVAKRVPSTPTPGDVRETDFAQFHEREQRFEAGALPFYEDDIREARQLPLMLTLAGQSCRWVF